MSPSKWRRAREPIPVQAVGPPWLPAPDESPEPGTQESEGPLPSTAAPAIHHREERAPGQHIRIMHY